MVSEKTKEWGREYKVPEQVVFYNPGYNIKGLKLEDKKENEDCLPDSLASMISAFPNRVQIKILITKN